MAEKIETGYVELTTKGAARVKKDLDDVGKKFKQTGGFASSAAKQIAAAFAGVAVVSAMKWWVDQIEEGEAATAKLNAVLKATGNTTGHTAQGLAAYASSLQQVTRFGDEATLGAATFLAALDKIGGQIMTDAIRLSQDLATVLGTDLDSAAKMVGKALQDPEQGLTALQRVGVKFTADQKELLKALVESGKHAEAQAMILAELEKRFGGAAKAAGDTLGGAIEKLTNNFGDLFQTIAAGNDGPLKNFVDIINEEITGLEEVIRLAKERDEMLNQGKFSDATPEQLANEGDVIALEARRSRVQQQIDEERRNRAQIVANRTGQTVSTDDPRVVRPEDAARLAPIDAALVVARQNEASANEKREEAARQAEKDKQAEVDRKRLEQDSTHSRWQHDHQAMLEEEYERMAEEERKLDHDRLEAKQELLDIYTEMADEEEKEFQEQMKFQDAQWAFEQEIAAMRAGAAKGPQGFTSQRMGLQALEQGIQQAALSKTVEQQQLEEQKKQNQKLDDANKKLQGLDELRKMNQFGAGAAVA